MISFFSNLFCSSKDDDEKLFESLYEDINGYTISHLARNKIGKEASFHLIYGELEFIALKKIYKNKKINEKLKTSTKFYDLGSGSGKIILGSSILLPRIEKFIGIELLKELYEASNIVKKNFLEIDKNKSEKINFINDNFFNINYENADIIFLHYPMKQAEELYLKLEEKFTKELKNGTIIITAIRAFVDKKNFIKLDKFKVKTSYGNTLIYCYRKI